jgi:hypothetical protein
MRQLWRRRTGIHVGVAATVAACSLVAFASPASAHANIVNGTTNCGSPTGATYQVTWTISNDWNLPETALVVAATGGTATVTPTSLTIPASGDGSGGAGLPPYASVTFVQTLDDSVAGSINVLVSSTYSDGYVTSNWSQVQAPTNCAPSAPSTIVPSTTSPSVAPTPAAPTPVIAAATSPTVPSQALAAAPAAIVQKIARSSGGAIKRPTLLATKLAPSKAESPITKVATFTG